MSTKVDFLQPVTNELMWVTQISKTWVHLGMPVKLITLFTFVALIYSQYHPTWNF